MRFFLLFVLLLLCFAASAYSGSYYYEYNDNCKKAYAELLSLKPHKAKPFLQSERINRPDNLMRVYIEDYDDCLLLLFNGDSKDLDRLEGNLDKRLDLLEHGGDSSPWYRLCKSGLYMHWAFIYVRFGENIKAANYFRKSFSLIKENKKRYPDFVYNDVFYGVEQAALGAIPDNFKWVASVFGLKGDVKAGINKLERFLKEQKKDDLLYKEVVIYYAYLKFYLLSNNESVWTFLNSDIVSTKDNLLYSFLKANIALNYRKAEDCIRIMMQAKKIEGYANYPTMDFELAQGLLFKQDYSCIEVFNRFLKNYKGVIFYKDALQQTAYAHQLKGNTNKALVYLDLIKHRGSAVVDADKQAMRFAEKGLLPDKRLLQIRLLIDGGYYEQAIKEVKQYEMTDFNNAVDKIEFAFRSARAYDEIGDDMTAISYYKKTMQLGMGRQEYYAARSALQIGFIYEADQKPANAILMYKQVLRMDGHDFKRSMDQQAKAGINRLSISGD